MRRGELSLKLLITIIVLLALLLIIFFPTIKRTAAGLLGLSGCNLPAECRTSCDEGYKAEMVGDAYCAEKFQGTKTNAVKCCTPLSSGSGSSGSLVRKGDIRVYYQGDLSSPLTDGSTVTWTRTGQGNNMQFTSSLKFAFQNMKDAKCYYSLKMDDKQAVYFTSMPTTQTGSYLRGTMTTSPFDPSSGTVDKLEVCPDKPVDFAPKLGKEEYKYVVGKNLRLTIHAIPKDCTENILSCTETTKSTYIKADALKPTMTLQLNDQSLVPNSLAVIEPGKPYTLKAVYTQPWGGCAANYDKQFFNSEDASLTALNDGLDNFVKQVNKNAKEDCFYDTRSSEGSLQLPEGLAPGFTFSLSLSMAKDMEGKSLTTQTYRFRTPRDKNLQVTGMTPGLTKEKRILIECPNAICTDFTLYAVDSISQCLDGVSDPLDLKVQTQTGDRFVVTLNDEELNGKYLCVQATVSKDGATRNAYATALYRLDLDPVKINIDHTPPRITVGYDPWKGILKFTCDDQLGKENDLKYVSGCPPKAFSYAYVTDPFLFATSVATGGTLNPAWSGCPDADQGKWLTWNSEKGEMPYIAHDVRVICMRGTDNAGNHAVESKLLYNGQEALAAILTEVVK